VNVYHLLMI